MLKVSLDIVKNMVDEVLRSNVVASMSGRPIKIYGVPRGGIPVAYIMVERRMTRDLNRASVTFDINEADLIVDDICDSGGTQRRYHKARPGIPFAALFDKQRDPRWKDKWLVMPWECENDTDSSAHDIVTRLFQYIGEDPSREGLKETPARFLAAWKEWAWGYKQDPAEVLKTFSDGANGYDEMVIVHNIPVISKCEHHLADIVGHAHVGYIPDGKIVGLSKLARLVEVFARRLQVQERLTVQIADAIGDHLKPKGVGVIVRAAHGCMSTRGVKIHGSVTTTSAMRGAFFQRTEARNEFLTLCKMAEDKQ